MQCGGFGGSVAGGRQIVPLRKRGRQRTDKSVASAVRADNLDLFGGQKQHSPVRITGRQPQRPGSHHHRLEPGGQQACSTCCTLQATDAARVHHLCLYRVHHKHVDQWWQGRGQGSGRGCAVRS